MDKISFEDFISYIKNHESLNEETKKEWLVYMGNPHITDQEKRKRLSFFYE